GGDGGHGWGGNYFSGRFAAVTNCTFADGTARGGTNGVSGGGGARDGSRGQIRGANLANSNGVFRLKNCILAYPAAGPNAHGTFADGGYNLSSDATPVWSHAASRRNVDPRLGELADHGGPTETYEPATDSPAINAGDPGFCLATDQRGELRPFGARCDIGAVELGVYRLRGLITEAGRGVSNVLVTVTAEIDGETVVTGEQRTDANGSYLFTLEPDIYTIIPARDGYAFTEPQEVVDLTNDLEHVDFLAMRVFTLRGWVSFNGQGIADVPVMVGDEIAFTDAAGFYVLEDLPPGQYAVVPTSDAMTFAPAFRNITLSSNAQAVDFTAQGGGSIRGRITRSAGGGVAGVTVSLGQITATTDATGAYEFVNLLEGDFTVTPTRAGFAFAPAATNITVTGAVTDLDFAATALFQLGGKIKKGVPGTVVTAGDQSALLDRKGKYLFDSLPEGNYLVTPAFPGYDFTPPAQIVELRTNRTAVNFAATRTYTLAGQITNAAGPMAGVEVSAGDAGSATTDDDGIYVFTGLPAGTYVVTPSAEGYAFTPASRSVRLKKDVLDADFGAAGTFSIRGTVRHGSQPVSNVVVSLGSRAATTDAAGNYHLTGLGPGDYVLTPSLGPNVFLPESRSVTLSGHLTGQDFSLLNLFTVAGRITEGAIGVAGVVVNIGTRSAVTDTNGQYSIANVPEGTNVVIPVSAHHLFTPAQRSEVVNSNLSGIDFAATSTFTVSGRVWDGAAGLTNVTVTLTNATSTNTLTTGSDGSFAFSHLVAGTYGVVPQRSGFAFRPAAWVGTLGPSQTNLVFDHVYRLLGLVTDLGVGMDGVTVSAGTNTTTTVTGVGSYSLEVPGGTQVVTPSRGADTFHPPSRTVTVDQTTAQAGPSGFFLELDE
ncbi:MAG TPA: carboxypeptidase regulatory-like domain-containing protein, partial [Methylomirabilota bacterium]|nr:carboxypeptidase regulatory-like domain-containing protein [Methylomirabilota bacterium]